MKKLLILVTLFAVTSSCYSYSGLAGWDSTGSIRLGIGIYPQASDGLDEYDLPSYYAGGWTGGSYRVNGVDNWDGDTGFYAQDIRASLSPEETKTWIIYIWAIDNNASNFQIAWKEFWGSYTDPLVEARMEYIQKPAGVTGGPEVGTVWTEPPTITLPLYVTSDGLTGHAFEFTLTMIPEPGSLVVLVGGLAGMAGCVLRRRRR